jgi:hypothetical protein
MGLSEEQRRKAKDLRLKKVYNISLEDYEGILESQGWKCPLPFCGRKFEPGKRFSVDHSHVYPFEVRAITCYQCNRYRVGSLTADQAWAIYQYLTDPPATRYFGQARSVPAGMEQGQKRKRRRSTRKRDIRGRGKS